MTIGTPTLVGSFASSGNVLSGTSGALSSGINTGSVCLVNVLGSNVTATATCSDSKGNTYTQIGTLATASTNNYVFLSAITSALTTSDTITVTKNNSGGSLAFTVESVTGTVALDGTAVTGSGSTTAVSTSALTVGAGDLVYLSVGALSTTNSMTPGTGFTADQNIASTVTNTRVLMTAYDKGVSAGSVTPSGTLANGVVWGAIAFALLPASTASQGTSPSTLVKELNRLANGGSYPSSPYMYLDADGAAQKWCGTPGLALNGCLNTKAGNQRPAWLDLDGVCNQLAGTTGLSAVNALIRIAS